MANENGVYGGNGKPRRSGATETQRRKGNRSAARVRILLTLVLFTLIRYAPVDEDVAQKAPRRDEQSRDARDRQAHEIERLRQENERLRDQLAEHAKRIADLERQLALRQQNST